MRDYVSSILESGGDYEVHEVGNGFDALRSLPREAYGLIVTDVNMPDVSGIELTRFVRSSPRHASTPLVVISTDASSVDVQRALDAGANAFVAKPFSAAEFLQVIDQAIERANSAQEASDGESS